ncbi:hypothetical protein [Lysobacter sp. Root916]|uniref:prealbumin-like fold domain-containing protein n=1 Tax=Lysobacter sp. Root916 TaxID=1736606 RepID=UPI000AD68910|nr:hypothetical protein [Lysobacter sp. Root916]
MRNRGAGLMRVCSWLLLALLGISGLAQAETPLAWTVINPDLGSATVNGTTIAIGGDQGTTPYALGAMTATGVYGNPYGEVIAGRGSVRLDIAPQGTTRFIAVTFSRPINNPILHIEDLGIWRATCTGVNCTARSSTSIWQLTSATATGGSVNALAVSGNAAFFVAGNTVGGPSNGTVNFNSNSPPTGGCSGTLLVGCGSVMFVGIGITQLFFTITWAGPAQTAFAEGINMTVSIPSVPQMQVVKRALGGTGSFSFTGNNGYPGDTVAAATAGAFVDGTSFRLGAAGVDTTISETAVAGWVTGANPTFLCYDGARAPPLSNQLVSATFDPATRTYTIPGSQMAVNSLIRCHFDNTRTGTVTVTKISNGDVGSFNFSGSNGIASHAITTATAGTGVQGAVQTLAATGTQTTITEAAPPAGFVLTGVTCTGLTNGATATFDAPTRTVTIPSTGTAAGASISCTFTNSRQSADLSITKTNTPGVNGNVDQASDTVTSGSPTTYELRVTNNGPDSVTGAVVRDTPGAGIACPGGNTVTITGDGVPVGSFTIANLTGAGITLGTLTTGQTTVLSFSCNVQ